MEATTSKWQAKKKKQKTLGLKAKESSKWLVGRLCPIKHDTTAGKQPLWYIKPSVGLPDGYNRTKDVRMNRDNISEYILPLASGDLVEFVLGIRDKSKPMAVKARVFRYSQRTCTVLVDYIENLSACLTSAIFKKVLVEILPNTVMWAFLGSPIFKEKSVSIVYIERLLQLLQQVLNVGKSYKTLMKESMKAVLQGAIFQSTGKQSLASLIKSCKYDGEKSEFYLGDEQQESLSAQLVRSLCESIIRHCPSIARCLLPTVQAIMEKTPASSATSFLYQLLQLSLSGENTEIPNMDVWRELPLILTRYELTSGDLVTKEKHLVMRKNTYEHPEEYMETYFRLLRAETFESIQSGIKKFKLHQLDPRDMSVYYNVHLAGFELQNGRFSLAIHFRPATRVTKWENSSKLMFGNLVCISLNRKFDDVIWATASNRDVEMLNKHPIIMLETIDENSKPMTEIISSLQSYGGSGIMVESPTYYHATSPVLRSLKEFEMENFQLQKEIVYTEPMESPCPRYIQKADTLDPTPVWTPVEDDKHYPSKSATRMKVSEFLENFDEDCTALLDRSQRTALVHALQNRMAIIQGPPGCGKTFIGAKIVQLLLSLSPELEKPILLLTYKNHALDEFLKHMLEFCQPNDLVRIGGRSKEPKLESCNLHSIMRSLTKSNINKSNESKAVFTEIEETKNEIEKVETKIKEVALMVEASSQLEKKSFVQELTEEQLQLFLVEANWGQPPLAYKLNSKTFANKTSIRQFVTNIFQKHDSLQEFLMKAIELGVSNKTSNEGRCFDVFSTVLREWFPDRQHLQQLKEIQTEFVLNLQSKTLSGYVIPDSDDECPDDSGDEGYVKELAETRMISGIKQEKNPKNSLVIFSSIKSNPNDVLIEISDYPKEMTVNSQIRNVKNLWELTKPQRLQFLYSILRDRASSVSQELDGLIEQLRGLKNRKEELEMNYKVEQLSQKKIIGVTITGASINHDLICHIGPSVVIVEEAAEILEPSLLAALTPSTEHLILIGDHQQLRPQVNAYDLREEFDFDVSMMERLIKSKFEYKTLTTQNRMRPEFSTLLKDIYPNLKDNMPLVSMNEPLKCVGKSMFFWSHEYPEEKDRSYTNVKEAERIRVLVVYLLCSGCRPNEITVLSAYKGQTNLLRKMLKEVKTKMPQLFKDTDPGEFVHVQTIDMYQGDENKYVLISLVRSNKKKKIGFLAEINRRCVAQSRAKCGMYFVGNAATFMNSRWFKLVKLMRKEHCVGTDFPLRCTKHETSTFPAATADDINNVISNPKLLCKRMCEDIYACNIHHCKQTCFPRHRHDTCPEIVEDVFPTCLHPVKRKCSQQISNLKCTRTVKFKGSCGHDIQKKCHQKNENVKCPVKPCTKLRKCKHPCGNTCGEDCEMGDCKDCMDIHERKMKMFRKEAEKEAKAIADRIEKKEESEFSIDEISSSGEDSAEYTMVKDQVMKFIQPMHQWFPEIVKIEKVTNLVLQKKFEEAKTKAFGDFICMKFHGTSDEGVKGITKDGFRMPKQDLPFQERGMFGQGIYFATDSSKSAREIYTKGSNKLLLCDVFLGKVKEVRSSDRWWNRKKLKSQKFDSLHAPRNSAVKNDEFVIFNPDQALPRYIIHFKPSNHVVPPSPKHLTHLSFFTKTMKASRQVNFQDPYEMFYNYAESHFRRMSKNQFTIKSIDIVINKELSVAFEKTKRNFKEKDIPNQEILAYHGTDKNNIDSILKANLQVAYSKRQRYGKGNYFSEFPAVSLKYGDGLLLCRILPGKEYVNSDDCNIPPEYNSKKVLLRDLPGTDIANASGEMIIIENSNQILPFFVIHFD